MSEIVEEQDDRVLAAQIGLRLAEENKKLHDKLKETTAQLEQQKNLLAKELKEQEEILTDGFNTTIQLRRQELAQRDALIASFREQEKSSENTISNLTRQV